MYKIKRNNGKYVGVRLGSMSIPNDIGNADYSRFLKWQSKQTSPLDLSDRSPDPKTPEEINDATERTEIRKIDTVDLDNLNSAQLRRIVKWLVKRERRRVGSE